MTPRRGGAPRGGLVLGALALAAASSLPSPTHAQPAPPAAASDDAPSAPPAPSAPSAPPAPPAPAGPHDFLSDVGVLSGTILSEELDAPLAGADLAITPLPPPGRPGSPPAAAARRLRSGDDGRFSLELAPGAYLLRAVLEGFRPVERTLTVTLGQATTVELSLPLTQALTEVIVVVGSRTPRTNVESPVPVDVITADDIARSGQSETGRVLHALAPSFIAKSQAVSDGTDHIDPASLRGLGPDQLLVLVNGKRRHQSALLNVNSTFGRGSVGVDLSAIPTASIKRIEILRDGAASQYGSDAISGVINIVLKESTDVIDLESLSGITASGDGARFTSSANYGFRLGSRGYLNVTAELVTRQGTNRAGRYTGSIFTAEGETDEEELARRGLTRDDFRMRIGEAAAVVGMAAYNLEYPISDEATLYSFGGLTRRDGEAAGFYRLPYQTSQTVPELYPHGFLPELHSDIADLSLGGGLRGEKGGWQMDLSVVHGANSFQFNVENSLNASLGTASPTTFDAGTLAFDQTIGNLDLLRKLDPGPLASLSLALGVEYRVERYAISAGDLLSWRVGDSMTPDDPPMPRVPGSQVFPGFRPENEIDRSRNNMGAYVGLESKLTKRAVLDIGGRVERYSDFGGTLNGKIAGRYELRDGLALRGAASTGFRAPSLHQLWFSTIATNFITNPDSNQLEAAQVLTSNNASPVTRAFGIPPLEEERSLNLSLGVTFRPSDNLSITADAYLINIYDRIVLAGRFTDDLDSIRQILAPFPAVTAAQFFANGVDTQTRGMDVVIDYTRQLGAANVTFTASANFTRTDVHKVNLPEGLREKVGDDRLLRRYFFGRGEENRIETSLPHQKGSIALRYSRGTLSGLVRANLYGAVFLRPDNSANDERFDGKALFDLEAGYQVTRKLRLTVGAENFLNTFPDEQQKVANTSAGRFVYSNLSQFGVNGGFYYGKLQLSFF